MLTRDVPVAIIGVYDAVAEQLDTSRQRLVRRVLTETASALAAELGRELGSANGNGAGG